MSPIQFEPGIYHDVPFPTYLSWPLLSQSTLKLARPPKGTMKLARHYFDHPKEPTDLMLLGKALHVVFLEPEMPERVILWDGERRTGKAWEAFKAEHADKVILTKGFYAKLQGMVRSMRQTECVRAWTRRIEAVEVSAVKEIDGVLCKCRCDGLTDEPLIELKKVSAVDKYTLTKTINEFGYHLQAAMQLYMFERTKFRLICVEDSPPYDCVEVEIDRDALVKGWKDIRALIRRWKECEQTGVWPGMSDEPIQVTLPEWAEDIPSEFSISRKD